eukprot:2221165-Pleurochrysis_carterae.AAC.3
MAPSHRDTAASHSCAQHACVLGSRLVRAWSVAAEALSQKRQGQGPQNEYNSLSVTCSIAKAVRNTLRAGDPQARAHDSAPNSNAERLRLLRTTPSDAYDAHVSAAYDAHVSAAHGGRAPLRPPPRWRVACAAQRRARARPRAGGPMPRAPPSRPPPPRRSDPQRRAPDTRRKSATLDLPV